MFSPVGSNNPTSVSSGADSTTRKVLLAGSRCPTKRNGHDFFIALVVPCGNIRRSNRTITTTHKHTHIVFSFLLFLQNRENGSVEELFENPVGEHKSVSNAYLIRKQSGPTLKAYVKGVWLHLGESPHLTYTYEMGLGMLEILSETTTVRTSNGYLLTALDG
ncbi:hypothetical protein ZHAS_00020058 [Anopheles sinensis]|uniref:Uncharacterized protein n=1 Tax=Anopheles sinensis TaxID=74873 RepID=A0A084WNV4_ANOSI|nr:hypothetical protein ZHAS_00020058 [Anopheles sinensis]